VFRVLLWIGVIAYICIFECQFAKLYSLGESQEAALPDLLSKCAGIVLQVRNGGCRAFMWSVDISPSPVGNYQGKKSMLRRSKIFIVRETDPSAL